MTFQHTNPSVTNTAGSFTNNVSMPFRNGCRIKADTNNSNTIALGITGTHAGNTLTIGTGNNTDGWKLAAGEEVPIPVSMAADLANIWVIAASGTQIAYAYGS